VLRPELRSALELLARNHRWTWQPRTRALLDALPTAAPGRHPLVAVQALDDDHLDAILADEARLARVRAELAGLRQQLVTRVEAPDVVYYSPEFGISELVPQYSGGLGILAGDHLKSASDLGTDLAAVGLFYREGFFRQEIGEGRQVERYEVVDPAAIGIVDTGLVVEVPIGDRVVHATVRRLDVGRIPLLLLDTDRDDNSPADRAITDRLYSGDTEHRLLQELVLGVGGARAVAAMGWAPTVHHLNEGHAGFLVLELLDREIAAGAGLADALAAVRSHVVFTTHTPVPAGIDRFVRGLVEPVLAPVAARWGVGVDDVLALGTDPADAPGTFNMAALCLRSSVRANGVSKLHGEVSRQLFAGVPGGAAISHVTNGVHARTWVAPELQELFDARLGADWDLGDRQAWTRAWWLTDDDIVGVRARMRERLAGLLRERAGVELDPSALVVGFARRFATYKRATLLLGQPDALEALLADDDRPVHLVFAGKAHPADKPGKQLLAQVVAHGASPAAHGRFTFLPDYDMAVARAMYAGSDVWLNTPVRPHEASGTSGEKAALNGALNCSIRDGWWDEMTDGRNGYDIPTADKARSDRARDEAESAALVALLAQIATDRHDDPAGWLDRVRHVWASLGPQVTATRMVADYERLVYGPVLARHQR
jgi:starch phosphorylase